MNNKFPFRLYLVISEKNCIYFPIEEVVRQAIIGGVDVIQLREKNMETPTFIKHAKQIKAITTHYGIPLIINDNLAVANAINSFGIHVGQHDKSPAFIKNQNTNLTVGYSIEHKQQLLDTENIKHTDYIAASPVFSTPTKTNTITEWGYHGIEYIKTISDKPLVGIGSMNKQTAYNTIKAGADCLAVVSAICASKNPQKAALEIRNEIEKAL